MSNVLDINNYEYVVCCRIVYGEAGNQDNFGKCLVAQCLRQACFDLECNPSEAAKWLHYDGWADTYDDDTEDAVKKVFYKGYTPVDDKIKFFYAPKYSKGEWHETQRFVIQYGDHKFFAEW